MFYMQIFFEMILRDIEGFEVAIFKIHECKLYIIQNFCIYMTKAANDCHKIVVNLSFTHVVSFVSPYVAPTNVIHAS